MIQCDSQGIPNKKAELMHLIFKQKPDVLFIQETMQSKLANFDLKNCNELIKQGHTNYRAHAGVTIFIH